MPRAGGESDKLGNRYEGIWTVDSLLDVLQGEATSLIIEPFGDDAVGIEFIKALANGTREFHSVKRQTTRTWSLSELTKIESNGRSKLGDLFRKLEGNANGVSVFISANTAGDLTELSERASRSQTAEAFETHLKSNSGLRSQFEKYVLAPIFKGNFANAYSALRRIRVDGQTESRLIKTVEDRICLSIYRPDWGIFDPALVRLVLGEMIYEWFGQPITQDVVLQTLAEAGFAERDWTRDPNVQARFHLRAESYLRHVEKELIVDPPIERAEALEAFKALRDGVKSQVVIMGLAGLGKSCTTAQIFRLLKSAGIPVLPVRLDIQAHALTARQLGHALDLPESPVVVLAGVAAGRKSVLVLDQLDALSFASGRNQQLWDAFDEILHQAEHYPNMRLLLVCRVFDAEHDPRIRKIISNKEQVEVIALKQLELEKVRSLLVAKCIDLASLGKQAMELLQLPLNLSLFLQGDPSSQKSFSSQEELLDRYWTHKRERAGKEIRWIEVIKRLSDWLSDRENRTLSAPLDVLDNEFPTDAAALCSLNVLVREGNSYRFFHETFFDYCWARFFISSGGHLLDLLLSSEQHLYRRAQVRQVLAYVRSTRPDQYLRDLNDVLSNPRIRFHLKKFTLDWLRTLPDPRETEWRIIESATPLGSRAYGGDVLWRSVPWFDLLLSLGIWRSWLQSTDEAVVVRAVWLLAMPEILSSRSKQVAQLFGSCISGELPWRPQYLGVFQLGEIYHDREIFDFLLWVIRAGHFDQKPDRHWMTFHDLPDKNAAYAAELLGAMFERYGELEDDDSTSSSGLSPDFAIRTADKDPKAFLRHVLPDLNRRLSRTDKKGYFGHVVSSRMMQRNCFGDVESSMLPAIGQAMEKLAKNDPLSLDDLSRDLVGVDHVEAAAILLKGWTQNPAMYADCIVGYLLSDPSRLELGYMSWSSGNGTSAISRAAVRTASPLCNDDNYSLLESAIMGFSTTYERDKPKMLGYHSLLLLECLPKKRITPKARVRFDELKRRFPSASFDPPEPIEASFVPSPIPRTAILKMSDKQWLNAMKKYSQDRSGTYDGYRKGGIYQLRGELVRAAQIDKKRFATLAFRMDQTVKAEYLSAILSGVGTESNSGNAGDEMPPSALEALDVQTMESLILHIHSLRAAELGKDLCWAIKHIAYREPSAAILPIVSYCAINDPDPEKETWSEENGGQPLWGGDPHFQGMNSVRGAAAEAIAGLLFKKHDYFSLLEPAILSLLNDPSTAVRACAVLILTASLNFDRVVAVDRFLELCGGHEALLGTRYVEQFLYHGCYDQYAKLRPTMLRMLTFSEDKEARTIAAGQITIASFHDNLAAEDLPQVYGADAVCRKAAADIYAHNLGNARVADICRENIVRFFDDPDKEVRAAAAACFHNLAEDRLLKEEDLMQVFINSQACLENTDSLIRALEESVLKLPEVVCALPERLIADQRAYAGTEHVDARRWTYRLPSLIARLYEQTRDEAVKTRCLNIIDGMLELGFGEIESELQKVES